MNDINLSDVYTTVGNVLGTPVALAFFWVVNKVKELNVKVQMLEKENAVFKQTLSDIRSDVSFIRGKLEKE
jgi:hypothetical protein